jgi:hypothetical protein
LAVLLETDMCQETGIEDPVNHLRFVRAALRQSAEFRAFRGNHPSTIIGQIVTV